MLTISNPLLSGVEGSDGRDLEPWVGPPLEPWEREDHGMIPRRTEYCHQSRMGQIIDRKREQPSTVPTLMTGQKEARINDEEKVKALISTPIKTRMNAKPLKSYKTSAPNCLLFLSQVSSDLQASRILPLVNIVQCFIHPNSPIKKKKTRDMGYYDSLMVFWLPLKFL